MAVVFGRRGTWLILTSGIWDKRTYVKSTLLIVYIFCHPCMWAEVHTLAWFCFRSTPGLVTSTYTPVEVRAWFAPVSISASADEFSKARDSWDLRFWLENIWTREGMTLRWMHYRSWRCSDNFRYFIYWVLCTEGCVRTRHQEHTLFTNIVRRLSSINVKVVISVIWE
jgi:hypothetical protein